MTFFLTQNYRKLKDNSDEAQVLCDMQNKLKLETSPDMSLLIIMNSKALGDPSVTANATSII